MRTFNIELVMFWIESDAALLAAVAVLSRASTLTSTCLRTGILGNIKRCNDLSCSYEKDAWDIHAAFKCLNVHDSISSQVAQIGPRTVAVSLSAVTMPYPLLVNVGTLLLKQVPLLMDCPIAIVDPRRATTTTHNVDHNIS